MAGLFEVFDSDPPLLAGRVEAFRSRGLEQVVRLERILIRFDENEQHSLAARQRILVEVELVLWNSRPRSRLRIDRMDGT